MTALKTHNNAEQHASRATDQRIVLTLDAGGTNFAFSALRNGVPHGDGFVLPAFADDLDRSLASLVDGFERLIQTSDDRPAAISFAFPGPADYRNGVIFNEGNLPAYRGGVPVAAYLEERFGLPVYLNNDGDLFALGEAVAGLLPEVNRRLQDAGSARQYRNLVGVTLGTGLGGGVVIDGRLLRGDNSAAAEIWRLSSALSPELLAEEDASIRAVRTVYAKHAGVDPSEAPTPAEIYQIGLGERDGDADAARRAFTTLGRAVGSVIAAATCFVDGIVVIGGGLAGAYELIVPSVLETLSVSLMRRDGSSATRLPHRVFDLESSESVAEFAAASQRIVAVPGSTREVVCEPEPRLGIGATRLGTNQAAAVGAYHYAIQQLCDR